MPDTAEGVLPATTRADWQTDQEVRWCPGCGDYSILTALQLLMPDLDVLREDTVFISGIGCAARFPYYMNTYGIHGIHGRAIRPTGEDLVTLPTSLVGENWPLVSP